MKLTELAIKITSALIKKDPVTISDSGYLPNFCDVRILLVLVLLVELLAMVLALASAEPDFWSKVAQISLFSQWVALINAAVLCSLRNRLNKMSTTVNAFISYALMMSTSLSVALLVSYATELSGFYADVAGWQQHFLIRVVAISAVIYAVLLRYLYIHQLWQRNTEAQARAEIQALQARIRPHFLFNSMNTIASLISIRPDSAERAIEDLADLFRASLSDQATNTLSRELELTRSYLDIELLRLGERLRVNWQLEIDLNNLEIPALSLQPLAENAIYHGIEPMPGGGAITIATSAEGSRLVIRVSNPLSEDQAMHQKTGNRMAQNNIRQRLQLAYGGAASFVVDTAVNNYCVTIKIPMDKEV